MNVYVASSWRNPRQPDVVKALRAAGHTVYDFREPEPGERGFHWSDIDPNWKSWTPEQFRAALDHPLVDRGFAFDMRALQRCLACVLVLPCGRSAHLELGCAVGERKATCVLLADGEPEMMYRMADYVAVTVEEVIEWLNGEENPDE